MSNHAYLSTMFSDDVTGYEAGEYALPDQEVGPMPPTHSHDDPGQASHASQAASNHAQGRVRASSNTADELPEDAPDWLAPDWLAMHSVAVLVGVEGIGKSLWWVRVVAAVTTGSADESINLPRRAPRNVLLIITEDNVSEVRARLRLAGADLSRVRFLTAPDDDGKPELLTPVVPGVAEFDIEEEAREWDAAMVVVDAWLDTVAGRLQVKDPQQARQALMPWKRIARRTGTCVLLVTHANRLGTTNIRDLYGSTGTLRQFARVTLFAQVKDDEERGERVHVGPDKANTTGRTHSLCYPLEVEQVRARTDSDKGTTARLGTPVGDGATAQSLLSLWAAQGKEAERRATRLTNADKMSAWLHDEFPSWPVVDGNFEAPCDEVKRACGVATGVSASGVRDNIGSVVRSFGGRDTAEGFAGSRVYRIPVQARNQSSGA